MKRSLLEQKLGRTVPESWTTTVPLKDVLHLLSDAEQTRLELTDTNAARRKLFLVSLEALRSCCTTWHTPRVKAWAAGRTFSTIAELRAQAANPSAAAVRGMFCALVRVGAVPGLCGGCTGRGSGGVVVTARLRPRACGMDTPPPRPCRPLPGPHSLCSPLQTCPAASGE